MKEISLKEKEYDTLRKEIMEWQSRRFSVATGSLVIVIAILGWAVNSPEKWSWAVVSSILFAMLTIASYLTLLMGLLNSGISTYIEVFHEEKGSEIGWEGRHRKFERRFISSKDGYAIMYCGIGTISLIISIAVCKGRPTLPSLITFVLFVASFLSIVLTLLFRPRPWKEYIKQWNNIKAEEKPRGE